MLREIKIDKNGVLENAKTGKGIFCPMGMNNPDEPFCIIDCAAYEEIDFGNAIHSICNMFNNNTVIGQRNKIDENNIQDVKEQLNG